MSQSKLLYDDIHYSISDRQLHSSNIQPAVCVSLFGVVVFVHFLTLARFVKFTDIRESVDSPCRDGADAQYMQYLSKSRVTSPQTRKKLICIQASCLSAFVISKTHISGQKPRGRQLNTKKCDSKSAIFVILLSGFFLCSDHLSSNHNSKTAKALTLI